MQLDKEEKLAGEKKYGDMQCFEVKNSPKNYKEGRGAQHSHMRENLVTK